MTEKNIMVIKTWPSKRVGSLSMAFVSFGLGYVPVVVAAPEGGVVTAGQATITTTNIPGIPQVTQIHQTSNQALIDWQDFSIGANEEANFSVPSGDSMTINRVLSNTLSEIQGKLKSNGQIMLINPSGILFGQDSIVDVSGLVASTLKLQSFDSKTGQYEFERDENYNPDRYSVDYHSQKGSIQIDKGALLKAQEKGFAVLLSEKIKHKGTIVAPKGKVILSGQAKASVKLKGSDQVGFLVDETNAGNANNPDMVQISQDKVILTLDGQSDLVSGVLNMDGTTTANQYSTNGNMITLTEGEIDYMGQIQSESGSISVSAKKMEMYPGSSADVSSSEGAAGKVSINTDIFFNGGVISVDGKAAGSIEINANFLHQYGNLNANSYEGKGGDIRLSVARLMTQSDSSMISAMGIGGKSGNVIIKALQTEKLPSGPDAPEAPLSKVYLSGYVNVSSEDEVDNAGSITLLGDDLYLQAAIVKANGKNGGTINVGGSLQGLGPLPNAVKINLSPSTVVEAFGKNGNGGNVILWSDKETTFRGKMDVGSYGESGNGGFVEISSKDSLKFSGEVNVSAENGSAGTLLLDPKNIIIDTIASYPYLEIVDPGILSHLGPSFGASSAMFANGVIVIGSPADSSQGPIQHGALYFFDGNTGALKKSFFGATEGEQLGKDPGNTPVRLLMSHNKTRMGLANNMHFSSGISANASGAFTVFAQDNLNNLPFGTTASTGNGLEGSFGDGQSMHALAMHNKSLDYFMVIIPYLSTNILGVPTKVGGVQLIDGLNPSFGALNGGNVILGDQADDRVGLNPYDGSKPTLSRELSNGHFALVSPFALGNKGAVTVISGYTTTISNQGDLFSKYSWVGAQANDQVGSGATFELFNGNVSTGNIAIASPMWANGGATQTGAITVISNVPRASIIDGGLPTPLGPANATGIVSAANSVTGTNGAEFLGFPDYRDNFDYPLSGYLAVTDLQNGQFIVMNKRSNIGAINAGAIAMLNSSDGKFKATSLYGAMSTANSLYGNHRDDGQDFSSVYSGTPNAPGIRVQKLIGNNNYLMTMPNWDNDLNFGGREGKGAAYFGLGTVAPVGTITSANAFTGNNAFFRDGIGVVTYLLNNGGFYVGSPFWFNGGGALKFGDGVHPIAGLVSGGTTVLSGFTFKYLGFNGTPLSNGNLALPMPFFNFQVAVLSGTGSVGFITSFPSITDSSGSGVTPTIYDLKNGSILISSNRVTAPGGKTNAGAITIAPATPGISYGLNATNTLYGANTNDHFGDRGVYIFTKAGSVSPDRALVVSSKVTNPLTLGTSSAITQINLKAPQVGSIDATNTFYFTTSADFEGDTGYAVGGAGTVMHNGVSRTFLASPALDGNKSGTIVLNDTSFSGGPLPSYQTVEGNPTTAVAYSSANVTFHPDLTPDGNIIMFQKNTLGGRVFLLPPDPTNMSYKFAGTSDVTINPGLLTDALNAGANVVLQASNDITISKDIIVNNPTGNGGTINLSAGRDINISANITTDNADITLTSNETTNVDPAQRQVVGDGTIKMLNTSTIDAGTGNIFLINNGASGNVIVSKLISKNVTIVGKKSITMADAAGSITAAGTLKLGANGGATLNNVKVKGVTAVAADGGTNMTAFPYSTGIATINSLNFTLPPFTFAPNNVPAAVVAPVVIPAPVPVNPIIAVAFDAQAAADAAAAAAALAAAQALAGAGGAQAQELLLLAQQAANRALMFQQVANTATVAATLPFNNTFTLPSGLLDSAINTLYEVNAGFLTGRPITNNIDPVISALLAVNNRLLAAQNSAIFKGLLPAASLISTANFGLGTNLQADLSLEMANLQNTATVLKSALFNNPAINSLLKDVLALMAQVAILDQNISAKADAGQVTLINQRATVNLSAINQAQIAQAAQDAAAALQSNAALVTDNQAFVAANLLANQMQAVVNDATATLKAAQSALAAAMLDANQANAAAGQDPMNALLARIAADANAVVAALNQQVAQDAKVVTLANADLTAANNAVTAQSTLISAEQTLVNLDKQLSTLDATAAKSAAAAVTAQQTADLAAAKAAANPKDAILAQAAADAQKAADKAQQQATLDAQSAASTKAAATAYQTYVNQLQTVANDAQLVQAQAGVILADAQLMVAQIVLAVDQAIAQLASDRLTSASNSATTTTTVATTAANNSVAAQSAASDAAAVALIAQAKSDAASAALATYIAAQGGAGAAGPAGAAGAVNAADPTLQALKLAADNAATASGQANALVASTALAATTAAQALATANANAAAAQTALQQATSNNAAATYAVQNAQTSIASSTAAVDVAKAVVAQDVYNQSLDAQLVAQSVATTAASTLGAAQAQATQTATAAQTALAASNAAAAKAAASPTNTVLAQAAATAKAASDAAALAATNSATALQNAIAANTAADTALAQATTATQNAANTLTVADNKAVASSISAALAESTLATQTAAAANTAAATTATALQTQTAAITAASDAQAAATLAKATANTTLAILLATSPTDSNYATLQAAATAAQANADKLALVATAANTAATTATAAANVALAASAATDQLVVSAAKDSLAANTAAVNTANNATGALTASSAAAQNAVTNANAALQTAQQNATTAAAAAQKALDASNAAAAAAAASPNNPALALAAANAKALSTQAANTAAIDAAAVVTATNQVAAANALASSVATDLNAAIAAQNQANTQASVAAVALAQAETALATQNATTASIAATNATTLINAQNQAITAAANAATAAAAANTVADKAAADALAAQIAADNAVSALAAAKANGVTGTALNTLTQAAATTQATANTLAATAAADLAAANLAAAAQTAANNAAATATQNAQASVAMANTANVAATASAASASAADTAVANTATNTANILAANNTVAQNTATAAAAALAQAQLQATQTAQAAAAAQTAADAAAKLAAASPNNPALANAATAAAAASTLANTQAAQAALTVKADVAALAAANAIAAQTALDAQAAVIAQNQAMAQASAAAVTLAQAETKLAAQNANIAVLTANNATNLLNADIAAATAANNAATTASNAQAVANTAVANAQAAQSAADTAAAALAAAKANGVTGPDLAALTQAATAAQLNAQTLAATAATDTTLASIAAKALAQANATANIAAQNAASAIASASSADALANQAAQSAANANSLAAASAANTATTLQANAQAATQAAQNAAAAQQTAQQTATAAAAAAKTALDASNAAAAAAAADPTNTALALAASSSKAASDLAAQIAAADAAAVTAATNLAQVAAANAQQIAVDAKAAAAAQVTADALAAQSAKAASTAAANILAAGQATAASANNVAVADAALNKQAQAAAQTAQNVLATAQAAANTAAADALAAKNAAAVAAAALQTASPTDPNLATLKANAASTQATADALAAKAAADLAAVSMATMAAQTANAQAATAAANLQNAITVKTAADQMVAQGIADASAAKANTAQMMATVAADTAATAAANVVTTKQAAADANNAVTAVNAAIAQITTDLAAANAAATAAAAKAAADPTNAALANAATTTQNTANNLAAQLAAEKIAAQNAQAALTTANAAVTIAVADAQAAATAQAKAQQLAITATADAVAQAQALAVTDAAAANLAAQTLADKIAAQNQAATAVSNLQAALTAANQKSTAADAALATAIASGASPSTIAALQNTAAMDKAAALAASNALNNANQIAANLAQDVNAASAQLTALNNTAAQAATAALTIESKLAVAGTLNTLQSATSALLAKADATVAQLNSNPTGTTLIAANVAGGAGTAAGTTGTATSNQQLAQTLITDKAALVAAINAGDPIAVIAAQTKLAADLGAMGATGTAGTGAPGVGGVAGGVGIAGNNAADMLTLLKPSLTSLTNQAGISANGLSGAIAANPGGAASALQTQINNDVNALNSAIASGNLAAVLKAESALSSDLTTASAYLTPQGLALSAAQTAFNQATQAAQSNPLVQPLLQAADGLKAALLAATSGAGSGAGGAGAAGTTGGAGTSNAAAIATALNKLLSAEGVVSSSSNPTVSSVVTALNDLTLAQSQGNALAINAALAKIDALQSIAATNPSVQTMLDAYKAFVDATASAGGLSGAGTGAGVGSGSAGTGANIVSAYTAYIAAQMSALNNDTVTPVAEAQSLFNQAQTSGDPFAMVTAYNSLGNALAVVKASQNANNTAAALLKAFNQLILAQTAYTSSTGITGVTGPSVKPTLGAGAAVGLSASLTGGLTGGLGANGSVSLLGNTGALTQAQIAAKNTTLAEEQATLNQLLNQLNAKRAQILNMADSDPNLIALLSAYKNAKDKIIASNPNAKIGGTSKDINELVSILDSKLSKDSGTTPGPNLKTTLKGSEARYDPEGYKAFLGSDALNINYPDELAKRLQVTISGQCVKAGFTIFIRCGF